MMQDFDFSKPWTRKKRNKFKGLVGMSRETFLDLYKDVEDYLPVGRSTNGKSLLPVERLMYFLKFFCKNELTVSAAYSNDVSAGALSENISIMVEALNPKSGPNFCKRHIYLPSTVKSQWEAMQFHEKYGFPPLVVGHIDGSHCDVRKYLLIFFCVHFFTQVFSNSVFLVKMMQRSFTTDITRPL